MSRCAAVALLWLALALQACHRSAQDPTPATKRADIDFVITLTLASQAGANAASSADEDFLNIAGNDFSVLMFDNNNAFVRAFAPDEFTIRIDADRIALHGNIDLLPVETEALRFMVLANWNSFDSQARYPQPAARSSLWRLCGRDDEPRNHFAYRPDGTASWLPDRQLRKAIPMFGISAVFSTVSRLNVEVRMLRALAKVEIIDNIRSADSSVAMQIVGCTLSHCNGVGRFIPDISAGSGNEDWSNEEIRVTAPSLTTDKASRVESLEFRIGDGEDSIDNDGDGDRYDGNGGDGIDNEDDSVGNKGDGTNGNGDEGVGVNGAGNGVVGTAVGRTFVAYIPEMALTEGERPEMMITIAVDSNGRREEVVRTLALDGYDTDSSPTNELTSILRNHIYSYSVNSVKYEPTRAESDDIFDNFDISFSIR